jgi:arsenite/tail-anchored protein-transporting ATPase
VILVIGIDTLLRERKLILVTGKGGIGKTLASSMLARRAVALGRRVLVVEQSSVAQIGPLLGFTEIGHEEQWIGSLGVANFSASGNFRDYVSNQLMKSHLLDVLLSNKIVHSLFTAIPGFGELMLLGRLYFAMNVSKKTRPDLIIMDSYASGHFLSLMTTPDAVLQSGLAGPIIRHTTSVKNWLEDKNQCSMLYVAVAEDLVISEALEFLPILAEKSPVNLAGILMNRTLPALPETSAAQKEGVHDIAIDTKFGKFGDFATKFMEARRERQRHALEKYAGGLKHRVLLKNLPVWCLPEMGAVAEPITAEAVDLFLGGDNDR